MLTILLLSALILVHELGHFLVARVFGVKVEEFGIGIPPKALTLFRKGETEYTLNWLPLGGFVRLYGEDSDFSFWQKLNPKERTRALTSKPAWQRILIMLAGVFMNLVVGVLLFGIIYTFVGVPRQEAERVVVAQVVKGSPAEAAGLADGDILEEIDGIKVSDTKQFVGAINQAKGREVTLKLDKLGTDGQVKQEKRQVKVMPRVNPPEGEGALGVAVAPVAPLVYDKQPWYKAPFYGAVEGVKEAYGWTSVMFEMLLHPRALWSGLSGPVQVVKIGQQQATEGWVAFLRFGGIISFNLAVFNLLPLPALDGGRVVLVILEKMIGRKRVAYAERYINGAGMILLIGLMIVVTIRDLWPK